MVWSDHCGEGAVKVKSSGFSSLDRIDSLKQRLSPRRIGDPRFHRLTLFFIKE